MHVQPSMTMEPASGLHGEIRELGEAQAAEAPVAGSGFSWKQFGCLKVFNITK